MSEAERAYYARERERIERRVDPRCGICDEPIAPGTSVRYVDDERCHTACAEEAGLDG